MKNINTEIARFFLSPFSRYFINTVREISRNDVGIVTSDMNAFGGVCSNVIGRKSRKDIEHNSAKQVFLKQVLMKTPNRSEHISSISICPILYIEISWETKPRNRSTVAIGAPSSLP